MGVDMGISGISISYAAGYTASRNTGLHLHHGTELVYVQAGSCGNRLEEQEFSGKPGRCSSFLPKSTTGRSTTGR